MYFKVLTVLFLGEVSQLFSPLKKACGSHEFRHWGVRRQYHLPFLRQRHTITTRLNLIVGFGVLTVRCVRAITSPSSWRPASVDTGQGAKLPTNPASMGLSGHNDMCINGSAW